MPVLDIPGLRVDVASPRYLLAMKLLAAWDEDVDEGLDLVEAAYPGTKIPIRVQYLLEEHLAQPPER